jgi:hypothetical protein
MTFKKGDRIQTEDGQSGEVLFVDRGGQEAQVALERVSLKIRTETLRLFDPQEHLSSITDASNAAVIAPKKKRRPRSLKS